LKPILLEIASDDYAQAAKSPLTRLTVVISQNLAATLPGLYFTIGGINTLFQVCNEISFFWAVLFPPTDVAKTAARLQTFGSQAGSTVISAYLDKYSAKTTAKKKNVMSRA